MATTYKVLGQTVLATSNTPIALYTVGASKQAIASTLVVCNASASNVTYDVQVRVAGAASTTKQYIAYQVSLSPNSTTSYTLGITLATTDVVYVNANSTSVAFSLFGTELDA